MIVVGSSWALIWNVSPRPAMPSPSGRVNPAGVVGLFGRLHCADSWASDPDVTSGLTNAMFVSVASVV